VERDREGEGEIYDRRRKKELEGSPKPSTWRNSEGTTHPRGATAPRALLGGGREGEGTRALRISARIAGSTGSTSSGQGPAVPVFFGTPVREPTGITISTFAGSAGSTGSARSMGSSGSGTSTGFRNPCSIETLCSLAWNGVDVLTFKEELASFPKNQINEFNSRGQTALYCAAK
jgi:hypothetical protein